MCDAYSLRGITSSNGDTFSFDFDSANRLNKITRPGSQSAISYNSGNVLSSIVHTKQSEIIDSNQYAYDQRNIPVQKRTLAGNFDYSYNPNGQLVSSNTPVMNETFSYDSLANRNSDQNGSYSYSSSGKLVEQDYNFTYTHDRNGNMIGKFAKALGGDKVNYLYTSLNQLKEIQIHSSSDTLKKVVRYYYDPKGRRIKKSVLDYVDSSKTYSRSYIYDGENILAEYDDSGNRLANYTHSSLRADDILSADVTSSGQNAGLAYSSGKFYYLKDRVGSIDSITDGSGNVIQRYQYSAFGKLVNIVDGANNPILSSPKLNTAFTFTGREFDQESGLYFYRARSYDPSLGRFLQADLDPGKLVSPMSISNKYAYALNSPMQFTDPSGLSYIPIVSELLDFGHHFIADVGAALDRILKSPGFQTLATATVVVIGTVAAGIASPAVAIAAGIGALVGIAVSGDEYSAGMFLSKFPMSLFAGLYIGPFVNEIFGIPEVASGSIGFDALSSGIFNAPVSVLIGYILGTLPR